MALNLGNGLRYVGWSLVVLVLLYPIDVLQTSNALQETHGPDWRPEPGVGAMGFDLRTTAIHCSVLGWLGEVGYLLSGVWFTVAAVRLGRQRMRGASGMEVSSIVLVTCLVGVLALGLVARCWLQTRYGIILAQQSISRTSAPASDA